MINAQEFNVGAGSYIDPTAVIRGIDGPAEYISIGDHTYIGAGVQIICNHFEIGDYGKIHHDTNVHGCQPCTIGHNAWIGQYCIIDCTGGVVIGDNCGIGAHSQLWSHIKYGDTLAGCRFNSDRPLTIGRDCWFVGHCIVSPITAGDRSMAMVGSVVTKTMKANRIYAGVPAQDVTEKTGPQFDSVTADKKMALMQTYLESSGSKNIRLVWSVEEFENDGMSYFAVIPQKYNKTGSVDEVAFMKYLLPEKAKFVPC